MWRRLRRNGFRLSRQRVARIMAERGQRDRAGRRRVRTTIVDPKAAPAPELAGRDFTAPRPSPAERLAAAGRSPPGPRPTSSRQE
jgi:transposase InsO family protein